MNNLLPILAMTVGALVAGAIVSAVARRFSRQAATRAAEAHATSVVTELTLRVDELAADLLSALDRAESEGRRGRVLGDLNVSIDLDEVLDRISKTTISLDGVDAVVVSVDDPVGGRIVSTAGMTPEQARTQIFSSSPDAEAHSMSITYHYVEGADGRLRSALVLPLTGTTERLAFLTAYSRSRERNRDLAEDIGNDLEDVARRAGPAVENARRFREARRLAELDALTGLHNRRHFHEILPREVARAHRYDRRLALVVVNLDDFKGINERIGHLAGDRVLAETAERMLGVVRLSDIPCRVGGDEFAVILPESGIGQADQLYRRIQAAVSGRPIGHVASLSLSAGIAELTSEDDATSFFERADDALYRAKGAGKARAFPAAVRDHASGS